MTTYILRRLLQAIPQLFLISLILFMLMQSFGDPVATLGARLPPKPEDKERLRRMLGLDQPMYIQYLTWLVGNDWQKIDMDGDGIGETPGQRKGVLRGDWGNSLVTRRPVLEMIGDRLPNTLLLMGVTEVVIIVLSLSIGLYSALRPYSWFDNFVTTFSFIGFSMPVFWLALSLMYIFAVNFRRWGLPYLPTVGMFDPKVGETPLEIARHMVLPVTTLAIISIAGYSRFVRSSVLEVLSQDYVRTARAKGVRPSWVVWRHALPNAALPFITLIGLDIPFLLAGAVVTERIFAWPGTGRLFLDHLERSDFPMMMGILMLIAAAVVIFQIVTDVVYSMVDPRIRLN
ncbi:MAG: ABC transporter permease [Anaerolineales bacterium]|nr:ABC transporter permease [Anaerolineales bacterium]